MTAHIPNDTDKHIPKMKTAKSLTSYLNISKYLWSKDLVVKALDSQSRGSLFKTVRWLQGPLSPQSFPCR